MSRAGKTPSVTSGQNSTPAITTASSDSEATSAFPRSNRAPRDATRSLSTIHCERFPRSLIDTPPPLQLTPLKLLLPGRALNGLTGRHARQLSSPDAYIYRHQSRKAVPRRRISAIKELV